MLHHKLLRRKQLLTLLGHTKMVSRASWSHDLGDSLVFDAWEHQWERDPKGDPARYSLRTLGPHYNLKRSQEQPRAGHTRWQRHVDLALAGKRKVRAIVPVARKPGSDPNHGTMGWLPQYIEGHIDSDGKGTVWFVADRIVPIQGRN
jgi:hypothetical protein